MRIPLLFLAALAAGCASAPRMDATHTSANQDSRVQFVVIHFTNEDFASSLKTLTEPSSRPVSAKCRQAPSAL